MDEPALDELYVTFGLDPSNSFSGDNKVVNVRDSIINAIRRMDENDRAGLIDALADLAGSTEDVESLARTTTSDLSGSKCYGSKGAIGVMCRLALEHMAPSPEAAK